MKQEIKDIAIQAAGNAPWSAWALLTKFTVAEWVAITLGVLQALYLLRKWWREESEWGLRMKRPFMRGRADSTASKPMELDE